MIKSEKKEEENLSQDNNLSKKEMKKTTDLKKEESVDEKLKNIQDNLLRSMAEMENQRRRFEK